MKGIAEVQPVLAQYPLVVGGADAEALGTAGGFSGAAFWKIEGPSGSFCLRRWPREHPSPERLLFIHNVLRHVAKAGMSIVPAPILAADGTSIVRHRGHLWELAPWLPGLASFQDGPSDAKLVAAMECLATFHSHTASFASQHAVAPGILTRLKQLDELQRGQLERIQAACRKPAWEELVSRADHVLAAFRLHADRTRELLAQAAHHEVIVQPCIRDIWHDHVLFMDDEVTGIVDFGAMRTDHVAVDITRLLGSLVGDDELLRRVALDAYHQLRPLQDVEHSLIEAFDRSSTLLSGMNWLQWICVEGRTFSDRARVLARIDRIIERMNWL